MNRFISAFTLLGLAAILAGCGADREMTARVLTLEQHTKTQFRLLQQQNEFMNRKVNVLNDKVEDLLDRNAELTEELASYADRPYEVKTEIMSDLNTRFASIVNELTDFKTDLDGSVNQRIDAVDTKVHAKFVEMDALLTHHSNFVEFVAAEQDSINRVLANKIDARPWYESIIGKWEDKQRAENANP